MASLVYEREISLDDTFNKPTKNARGTEQISPEIILSHN